MDKIHLPVYDRVHIVFDIFRIRSNDRTVVVVVGFFKFVPLVRNRRIEDMFYTFVDQPLDMSMGEFRRIALGFAGNRLDAKLVDLSCGSR